jgi:hypothetical protein
VQFAIVNKSARIDDATVAFIAKACDGQAIEAAAAYGVEPIPVAFYAHEADLPARSCYIVALVDDLDMPGVRGYHDFDLGVVYVRVLVGDRNATSSIASHEFLEALLDRYCNEWRRMPDGRSLAFELCDPVQADTYAIPATIMGETRQVVVSNYVLPKYWDAAATGNFDKMGTLRAPFSMSAGGYTIVRDPLTGERENVFASGRRLKTADNAAKLTVATKLANSETRTARRLAA